MCTMSYYGSSSLTWLSFGYPARGGIQPRKLPFISELEWYLTSLPSFSDAELLGWKRACSPPNLLSVLQVTVQENVARYQDTSEVGKSKNDFLIRYATNRLRYLLSVCMSGDMVEWSRYMTHYSLILVLAAQNHIFRWISTAEKNG